MGRTKERRLTPKQCQAIGILMEGRTIKDTAKAVGVNEKTVDTWLNLPLFQEQLQLHQQEIIERAFRRLARYEESAIDFLASVVDDESAANRDRISAAKEIIKGVERIGAIEQGRRTVAVEKFLDALLDDEREYVK